MPYGKKVVITKKKFYRKPKGRGKKMQNKKIEQIVHRVISRNLEHKSSEYGLTGKLIFPGTGIVNNNDSNIIPMSPFGSALAIGQGTGDGVRVGNRITITKASLDMTIYPAPATSFTTPKPQNIMFILFYDKQNPTLIPTPQSNGDFYQNGNSVSTFNNNLTDITRWINFDRYKVFYKRVFKVGTADYEGTGASTANNYFANNDYKLNVLNFKVNLMKYLVKRVRYNDNLTTPMTRALFGMWVSLPADNQTWNGTTDTPAAVSFQLHIQYTDA